MLQGLHKIYYIVAQDKLIHSLQLTCIRFIHAKQQSVIYWHKISHRKNMTLTKKTFRLTLKGKCQGNAVPNSSIKQRIIIILQIEFFFWHILQISGILTETNNYCYKSLTVYSQWFQMINIALKQLIPITLIEHNTRYYISSGIWRDVALVSLTLKYILLTVYIT